MSSLVKSTVAGVRHLLWYVDYRTGNRTAVRELA